MDKPYKPSGYSSVSAYIMADDAQRLIRFVTEVFGAKQLRRVDNPDGTIMHAELQIDDTVVMVADGGSSSFPVWLHIYVSDVDASYRRALDAGGVSAGEPSEDDGIDRRAGVKDPVGNTWWISTPLG